MRTKLIAGLSAAIITLSGAGFTLAHADSDERMEQLQKLDPSAADYQTQLNSLVLQAQDQTKSMILEKAEQKAKLFEILTPEQEKEFIELQSEMGKKMSKRDADHDHGRHGDKKCH